MSNFEKPSPAKDIFRGPHRLFLPAPQIIEVEPGRPAPAQGAEMSPKARQAAEKISLLVGQFKQDFTNTDIARTNDVEHNQE